jgi:hypothetical protein
MFKIITLSTIAVLSSALPFFHRRNQQQAVATWPELDLLTTFKADVSLHTWDGKALKAYKDITATAKVDGDRNKVKLDAKVQIPLMGHVSAQVLVDLNGQTVYEYVPLLKLCQKQALPDKVNLKDILLKIYSEESGLATYDGKVAAAWDATVYDKFHATIANATSSATIEAYVDTTTHNGRWIYEETTNAKIPKLVISVPKGEEAATFTDSDFTITGCNSYETDPELMLNIWF